MDFKQGPTDDNIIVEAIFTPLENSSSAIVTSSHTVTLGVTVGATFVNIYDSVVTLTSTLAVTPITVYCLTLNYLRHYLLIQ